MVLIHRICITILFILLVGSADAGAIPSVKIDPTTADGSAYVISAANVHEAPGIDLSFYYDITTLANPKITPGSFASGAMMEANTLTAGFVHVVFMTGVAFNGSGPLATITFTKVGKLSGRVYDMKSVVYSTTVEQVATQSIIGSTTLASDSDLTSSDSATVTNSVPSTSTSGEMSNVYTQTQTQQSGSYLGSVTLSENSPLQENLQKEALQRDESATVENGSNTPQEVAQPIVPPASTSRVQGDSVITSKAKSAKEALVLLKSVEMPVQRFRAFNGGRTVRGLAPLFDTSAVHKAGVVQVPEIAVSDGKKKVTVKIELAASGMVPNFSLIGANLKSIKSIKDKVWELVALPKKGKSDVRLSVLMGSENADIPLVVIPLLDASVNKETLGLSEIGVNALLAKGDSKGKLVYDLNSDGRQDFLDDYILVAHYLLNVQKQQKPAQQKK